MGFISELQKYCNISSSEFCTVLAEVVAILDKYNAAGQVPHRQRLVWKLSNRWEKAALLSPPHSNSLHLRTLKQLRPTDRLRATLPRICEETIADKSVMSRLRSSSECSLESDLSDSDSGSYKASASDTESDIEMEVSLVSCQPLQLTPRSVSSLLTQGTHHLNTNQITIGWSFENESRPTLCSWAPTLSRSPPTLNLLNSILGKIPTTWFSPLYSKVIDW